MDSVPQYQDPYRHTCLIPYVDATQAPPDVAAKINVLPFRRNIFLLLGHSAGLFPHLMGVIGGCFNGEVRTIPLLDWVSYLPQVLATQLTVDSN